MGVFSNWWPSTNAHDINLDFVLKALNEMYTAYKAGDLNGQNFQILGQYNTLAELKNAIANPDPGDTYAVGLNTPYTIYTYIPGDTGWFSLGDLTGPTGPAGPQGQTGSTGATGAAATVDVGGTVTLPAGENATVENIGTSDAALLRFGIPRGSTGADGAQGPQGPAGPRGANGVGVPEGGTAGQIIQMEETGNTAWVNLFDLVYPVGSIYMSMSATSPDTLFGGTWQKMSDQFLVGAGNLYTLGSTGGEARHTLSIDEMPNHTHLTATLGTGTISFPQYSSQADFLQASDSRSGAPTLAAGSSSSHNNMPPYIAVNMWRRTS